MSEEQNNQEVSDATNQDVDAGTTDNSSDSDASTEGTASASESSKSGRADEAPTSDSDDVKVDFDSVPKHMRKDVEKFVKKYETDFKRAYTKKFQELGAKEAEWNRERDSWRQERQQFQELAKQVIQDPSKLEAIRKVYNIEPEHKAEAVFDEPTPNFKTVDELLAWNKQQMLKYKDQLREEVRREALQSVQTSSMESRWTNALKEKQKDKQFSKYASFIVDIANKDPEIKSRYTNDNELEILDLAQKKFQALLREDLEAIKEATLKEMKKKKETSGRTLEPGKTLTPVQKAAQSKDEVIARIRAKLGPAND